jgi:sec-independent protein translocase protein TatB
MFDISWTELLLIGVVALVVIGPKELPGVLRTLGQWMRKVRGMAADFQNQFQEAMREAEMADLKKQVDDMASDFKNFDPLGDVKKDVEAMGRDFENSIEGKPALPAGTGEQAAANTTADAAAGVDTAASTDVHAASTSAEPPPAALGHEPQFPIAEATAELRDKDVVASATGPVTAESAKPESGGRSA